MIQLLRKNIHLLAVLSIAGQGLIYMLIGSLFSDKGIGINNWIDDRIPFLIWFVIPYAIWMPLLYISFIYLGLKDRSLYWRTIIAYNAAVIVCNIIFILFPTYMPRPDISGNDIFTMLVQFIYSNDEPVNCFPSIHCLTSYLLLITMNRHKLLTAGLRITFSIVFLSIIASTVFIKQHAWVDVVGGVLLAEAAYRIVYYAANRQQAMNKKNNETSAIMNS